MHKKKPQTTISLLEFPLPGAPSSLPSSVPYLLLPPGLNLVTPEPTGAHWPEDSQNQGIVKLSILKIILGNHSSDALYKHSCQVLIRLAWILRMTSNSPPCKWCNPSLVSSVSNLHLVQTYFSVAATTSLAVALPFADSQCRMTLLSILQTLNLTLVSVYPILITRLKVDSSQSVSFMFLVPKRHSIHTY